MLDSNVRRILTTAALSLLLVVPALAQATTITILNLDGAGVGLNDPTVAAPVGGNSGTTKGAQALIVFETAAQLWAAKLVSNVEIKVDAHFEPLACTASSGTLGSASPRSFWLNFTNAPLPDTIYAQALANARSGTDVDPAKSDLRMQFNGAIGETGCLEGLSWYMGLDTSAPVGTISLLSVTLHEMSHGLGVLTLVDLATGAKASGFDDAYMVNLEGHSTGKHYPEMTDGQRLSTSTSVTDLHWTGASVLSANSSLSGGVSGGHVRMYAPSPSDPGSSVSHFDTTLAPSELMEPSYTGANLDLTRTVLLMKDLGWNLCSNGSVEFGEQCDDGNVVPGDGCDAVCHLETSACPDAPSACSQAVTASFAYSGKKIGAESLKVSWGKLPSTLLSAFGDPVSGATGVAVCVYRDDNALVQSFVVDRAGASCGAKPCWSTKPGVSFAYKDAALSADGISSISFSASATAGKGKASATGKNNAAKGLNSLPTGLASALALQAAPTVQLHTTDGFCVSATMNAVKTDDGSSYQASFK